MLNDRLTRISKFLSLVLRHDPSAAGIALDAEGWIEVDELLAGADAKGFRIERAELQAVVETNDKRRFAFSADGTLIRASQGHSVAVDLGLQPIAPPVTLHHGTVERFLAAIRVQGLTKRSRQYVHLSADIETATRVGVRRGTPVILTVAAKEMHATGFQFFRSANGVWLTDHVPPRFISGLEAGGEPA